MKGFWKNNNGCVDARFHSLQTLQFILQRNANARLIGISTAATPSNNSIRKFYCSDRQLAPQHALQFLSTDVSEHEGHSWQPSKPSICTWPTTLNSESDDAGASDFDSQAHTFLYNYHIHIISTPPPSCVYRFLWERTISIILYTFNFPFLIYSLYLSGGPIPRSK